MTAEHAIYMRGVTKKFGPPGVLELFFIKNHLGQPVSKVLGLS